MTRILKSLAWTVLSLVALGLGAQLVFSVNTALPPREPGTLRVASYNVHWIWMGGTEGSWTPSDWATRKLSLDGAVKALEADVIAFQEMESFARGAGRSQNLAKAYLLAENPDFAAAASGDPAVFPSTQPIFYRPDVLTLVDQGWFFFSDTPEEIYSRTFNGGWPAFASWAAFRAVDGGAVFRVVNVHTDFASFANRLGAAALVRDRVAPWIAEGIPVMVVGDLNAVRGTPTLRRIEAAGIRFLHQRGATFHADRGLHLFPAIDHIGVSRDLDVQGGPWVVQNKVKGRWPTDHHPVIADIALP